MSDISNEPMDDAMNKPLSGASEPLSDEQLNQLFKAARPQPPAQWQESFWQDLESKLEQPARPSAHALSGGNWIRKPWAAAAAALIVILLALPVSQKLAQQNQKDSPEQASEQHSPPAAQPDDSVKLGKGVPDLTQAPVSAGSAKEQNQAVQDRMQASHQEVPDKADSRVQASDQVSPAAGMMEKSNKTIPSSAAQDEAKQKMGLNPRLKLAPGAASDKAGLDQTGARLEKMIMPLQGELKQLQPGHYEIKVPVLYQQDLEKLIDALALPHNKLRRGQKDHDQVVYRLDIL